MLPTILIVGDHEIVQQLLGPFPPDICRLAHTTSTAEALNLASDASIVVIDAALPSDFKALCRRLRSDSSTADLPIVLRYHKNQDLAQALTDARVAAWDVDGLVDAIQCLVPELGSTSLWEPDAEGLEPEEQMFDDESMTVIWRRPKGESAAAEEWPPPPPTYQSGQNLIEFSMTFAGYLNSLIEALDNPAGLSPGEMNRLMEVSRQAPVETEKVLNTIQSGINGALMGKDLDRMKVLSSAKNSLYEKLQRLRTLASETAGASGPPSVPSASAHAAGGTATNDVVVQSIDELTRGPTAPQKNGKKSQLTLAAEAKKKRRTPAASRKREQLQRKFTMARGTARLDGAEFSVPRWVWMSIAAFIIIATGAWFTFGMKREEPSVQASQDNAAPQMQRVDLSETVSGILAHPQATDSENDRITYSVRWFINGALSAGVKTARLDPSYYTEGDEIVAEVRASDGNSMGSPMQSQPIIVQKGKKRLMGRTKVPAPKGATGAGSDSDEDEEPEFEPLDEGEGEGDEAEEEEGEEE